jgi:hypothetical protein
LGYIKGVLWGDIRIENLWKKFFDKTFVKKIRTENKKMPVKKKLKIFMRNMKKSGGSRRRSYLLITGNPRAPTGSECISLILLTIRSHPLGRLQMLFFGSVNLSITMKIQNV